MDAGDLAITAAIPLAAALADRGAVAQRSKACGVERVQPTVIGARPP